MRSMSVSGLLAMIIVGGLILDHVVIAVVVVLFAGLCVLCYHIGKANQ